MTAVRLWLAQKIAPRHYSVLPSYVENWIPKDLEP
jgi:hypothetical protein